MEKLPLGERPEPMVVGRGPSHAKAELLKQVLNRFGEGHLAQFSEEQIRELSEGGREKAPVELESVRAANIVSNKLLTHFGLQSFDIPERNVHFVNDKAWSKFVEKGSRSMTADYYRQAIFAHNDTFGGKAEGENGVLTAEALFHEFLHLKGHTALEADSENLYGGYRFGWDVLATFKKSEKIGLAVWFRGLHEAVVAEMEKRYSVEVLGEVPVLKEEVEWLASPEAKEYKDQALRMKGVAPEEISWISRDGKKYDAFGYEEQRRVLDCVVDAVYEDGEFASRDDAMDLFLKAQFDGRLLGIARLVDKAFGEKSFRLLGEMDADDVSWARVLDELTRRRRKIEMRRMRTQRFAKRTGNENEYEAYEAGRALRPRKEYARGKLRLGFETALPDGALLKASEDERGIARVVVEKDGKTLLDFSELVPEGTIFITPTYLLGKEGAEMKKRGGVGNYRYDREKKAVYVGDMRDASSIFAILHEIGHAWLIERTGGREAYEKIVKAAGRGDFSPERFRKTNVVKSWEERGASAGALRLMRYVRDNYRVNLLAALGSPDEAKKILYGAMLSYRFGRQYTVSESRRLTDEDAKILEVLFDQSVFKDARPKDFAKRKIAAREELNGIMKEIE